MTTNNSDLLQAVDQALDERSLTWAAKWIEDSLKGETNERVIEFAKNMAMTLRAAKTANLAPVAQPPHDAETLVKQWIATLQNESRITDEDAEDLTLRIVAFAGAAQAINLLTALEHQAHRNHEYHPAHCGECAMTEQIANKLREQLGLEIRAAKQQ